MHHEMLTQRALFCHHANTKRGTLSQHFVTHVVPSTSSGLKSTPWSLSDPAIHHENDSQNSC